MTWKPIVVVVVKTLRELGYFRDHRIYELRILRPSMSSFQVLFGRGNSNCILAIFKIAVSSLPSLNNFDLLGGINVSLNLSSTSDRSLCRLIRLRVLFHFQFVMYCHVRLDLVRSFLFKFGARWLFYVGYLLCCTHFLWRSCPQRWPSPSCRLNVRLCTYKVGLVQVILGLW